MVGTGLRALTASAAFWALVTASPGRAQQIDIDGPEGSQGFGDQVVVLPNGNIVVTAPEDVRNFAAPSRGGVYLYTPDGRLISSLTGDHDDDRIGSEGIVVLANGNFVILSAHWNNGRGAATWASGTDGVSGVVSEANSLVGASENEFLDTAISLRNGNYVVVSWAWNDTRGAVAWGDGNAGTTGVISPKNALVGSQPLDEVGSDGITELANGNYVVRSSTWSGAGGQYGGAATWCPGDRATAMTVSSDNSLTGEAMDFVGQDVTPLANGNYVVQSRSWHDGIGAATWGDGAHGTVGMPSSANSIIGSQPADGVGEYVTALPSGDYVVSSPDWAAGNEAYAGAVTWADGSGPTSAVVTPENSLVGSAYADEVGNIFVLDDGNYVVASPNWGLRSGAVTWNDAHHPTIGVISVENSMLGHPGDHIGSGPSSISEAILALPGGDYVVLSPFYNEQRGAFTWVQGGGARTGTVDDSNSVVGSDLYDEVGAGQAIALRDGRYVIDSSGWHGGVGAVTWMPGNGPSVGTVSADNSLLGQSDYAGLNVIALTNGNYFVMDQDWPGEVGAAIWVDGSKGATGVVDASMSFVGAGRSDRAPNVGTPNGNVVITSSNWSGNGVSNGGAVSLLRGDQRALGSVSPANSVLGNATDGGEFLSRDYDAVRDQLVVGRPFENRISIFRIDMLFQSGFD